MFYFHFSAYSLLTFNRMISMSKDFFNFRRTSGRIIRTVRFLKGKYESEKQLKSIGEQKVELLTMEN